MKPFDLNNFDFSNIQEDENSEELAKEIALLKAQGLTTNIDFEKAEEEEKLVQEKLKQKDETKTNISTNDNNEELEK